MKAIFIISEGNEFEQEVEGTPEYFSYTVRFLEMADNEEAGNPKNQKEIVMSYRFQREDYRHDQIVYRLREISKLKP